MTILLSQSQTDSFDERAKLRLLFDMTNHIKAYFPIKNKELLPDEHYSFCEKVVKKATFYGFETERCFFMFLNIMILLEDNFDANLKFKWAYDILTNPLPEPEYNLEVLADAALVWHLEQMRA